MSTMLRILRYGGRILTQGVHVVLVAAVAVSVALSGAAVANYLMTIPGSGTSFGSIVVSSIHYAQQLICDPATPASCGAVKAGNTAGTTDVAQVVADPNILAAINSAIPNGNNVISKGDATIGGLTDDPASCTLPLTSASCSISQEMKNLVNLANSPAQITSLTRAARNFPGCTVGTSSGSCLAAATATVYLQIQNTSSTATVACGFGVTAVIGGSTSFTLVPGQGANWGPGTGGVPSGALNCISSASSTPFYVEWL